MTDAATCSGIPSTCPHCLRVRAEAAEERAARLQIEVDALRELSQITAQEGKDDLAVIEQAEERAARLAVELTDSDTAMRHTLKRAVEAEERVARLQAQLERVRSVVLCKGFATNHTWDRDARCSVCGTDAVQMIAALEVPSA